MKKLITFFAAAMALLILGGLSASADQLEAGVYNLACVDGGRYLNVYAGWDWDGVNVCIWDADGSPEQKFRLEDRGGNRYVLYPTSSSGRVLDANRGSSMSAPMQAGNNIDIWQTNDAPAQEWYIDDQGGGKYKIGLVSNFSLALTCDGPWWNGGNVSLQNYTGANNQLWYLKRVDGGNSLDAKLNQRLANFNNSAYISGGGTPFVSQWGDYSGQCTWYCWGRAREKTGIWLNTTGDAKWWLGNLNTAGATAVWNSWAPRKDSIAVRDWGVGHVMYIEDVVGDTVYYTEANSPQDNILDAQDGVLKKTTVSGMAQMCTGYIYLY